MTTQVEETTAPSGGEVIVRDGRPVGYRDSEQFVSPLAALASVKTEGADAPATAVVVDQARREGILAGVIDPTAAEIEAFRAEGYELEEEDEMVDTATGKVLTQQQLAEFEPAGSADDEHEVSHQEQAAPVAEGDSTVTEVAAGSTVETVVGHRPDLGAEDGESKRGRHRSRRSRKPEAPKAPFRAPQLGKGRLLMVPQSVKPQEKPKSPRGSITLMQLLEVDANGRPCMTAPYLAHIATRIVERGGEPDFVVFTRTEEGFDHVRVAVRTKPDGRDASRIFAYFVIAEATGRYGDLLKYKDEAIHFGPLLRGKPIPRGEEKRTDALRDVIAEAANAINESIARRTGEASK